ASLVTGLPALIAPCTATEASAEFFYRHANLSEVIARIIDHFHAIGTDCTHEPLSDKRFHHGCEQERLHIHVEQSRNSTYSIIRVQWAEDEVTRHRGANRNVRSLNISDFSDHHYIWILSQNVSQPFGEG